MDELEMIAAAAGGAAGEATEDFLERVLLTYDRRIRSGEAERENVSALVERETGFQNRVVTGQGHGFLIDEPETFGGGGQAGDPAEFLLAAVGASLSVTMTAHAALRHIVINRLGIELAAWMDADSFFRPADGAVAGLQALQLVVRLDSAAERRVLDDLLATALAASPVVQSLRNAPDVRLIIEDSL